MGKVSNYGILVTPIMGGVLILLVSVFSCDKVVSIKDISVLEIDSLNTSSLIPNSFLVSSKLEANGDTLFYWDESKGQLILLDKDFDYIASLSNGKGNAPQQLTFHSGHSLFRNMYLVFGDKALVYDAIYLTFLGSFPIPDLDLMWVVEFNHRMLLGGYNAEKNVFQILSASLDLDQGFVEVKEELIIDFPERFDELSKVTEAVVINGFLYVLKPHIGHLVKIDSDLKIVFDKRLPFSFSEKENLITYDDGEMDVNYFESWSFATDQKNLYTLRHYDLSLGERKFSADHRKSIHVLNTDGDFIGRIILPESALFISFIKKENYLFTVDLDTEKYIMYEILP